MRGDVAAKRKEARSHLGARQAPFPPPRTEAASPRRLAGSGQPGSTALAEGETRTATTISPAACAAPGSSAAPWSLAPRVLRSARRVSSTATISRRRSSTWTRSTAVVIGSPLATYGLNSATKARPGAAVSGCPCSAHRTEITSRTRKSTEPQAHAGLRMLNWSIASRAGRWKTC